MHLLCEQTSDTRKNYDIGLWIQTGSKPSERPVGCHSGLKSMLALKNTYYYYYYYYYYW